MSAVVIYAKDLPRLTAFYAAVLAVPVTQSAPRFSQVGPDLTLVAMNERLAATVTITSPPRVREDMAIKPVLDVDDLEAVRGIAEGLGGGLHPAESEWRWRGATLCDGHDPEGNVFQARARN